MCISLELHDSRMLCPGELRNAAGLPHHPEHSEFYTNRCGSNVDWQRGVVVHAGEGSTTLLPDAKNTSVDPQQEDAEVTIQTIAPPHAQAIHDEEFPDACNRLFGAWQSWDIQIRAFLTLTGPACHTSAISAWVRWA